MNTVEMEGKDSPDYTSFGSARNTADWLTYLILYTPLAAVTVFGKFAFKLGSSEILFAQPAVIGITILGLLTGRLRAVPGRTCLYLATLSFFSFLQVFRPDGTISSLILLSFIFLPLIFELNPPLQNPDVHLRRVLKFAAIIGVLGVIQYLAQFVIGADYAYPIEHLLPKSMVSQTMNSLRTAGGYKSTTFESNGLFLAEPANFSQFMAIALTLELITFRNRWRLFACTAGIVSAFSGTGLIILFVTIPAFIVVRRRFDIFIYMAVAGGLLISAADVIGLGRFVDRASEFSDPNTSASARFVGQYRYFDQYVAEDPESWLLGLGSGTIKESKFGVQHQRHPLPDVPVASAGVVKIFSEYGLIGATFFFTFYFYCVMSAKQPLVLRLSLMPMPLLIGIMDAGPVALIITLLLWSPMPKRFLEKWNAHSKGRISDNSASSVDTGSLHVPVAARAT